MTTITYCNPADVKRYLQVPHFDASTTPNDEEVKEMIVDAENEINDYTMHSWKEETITDQYYDFPDVVDFDWGSGIPIYLNHRKIRSFTKIEIFTGTAYDDWVSTKTEGRNNNYWADYNQGILYLKIYPIFYKKQAIRLTYTYGETTVPNSIRKACALLVASEILAMDDRASIVADSADINTVDYNTRISRYRSFFMINLVKLAVALLELCEFSQYGGS